MNGLAILLMKEINAINRFREINPEDISVEKMLRDAAFKKLHNRNSKLYYPITENEKEGVLHFSRGEILLNNMDADIYNYSANNVEIVTELFTKAIKKDFTNPIVYLNRGEAKFKIKDYKSALKDFYRVLNKSKECIVFGDTIAYIYSNIAYCNQGLEDWKEAISAFEKLFKEGKEIDLNTKLDYAVCILNDGDYSKTLNFLDRIEPEVATKKDKSYYSHFELIRAKSLFTKGDLDFAFRSVNRAINFFDERWEGDYDKLSSMYILLANIKKDFGEDSFSKSNYISDLCKALSLDPSNIGLRLRYVSETLADYN